MQLTDKQRVELASLTELAIACRQRTGWQCTVTMTAAAGETRWSVTVFDPNRLCEAAGDWYGYITADGHEWGMTRTLTEAREALTNWICDHSTEAV